MGDRTRRRSPPAPKMQTFHGEQFKWRSFYFQFKETAKSYHWKESVKLERLMASMRDKAIDFIEKKPKSVRGSFPQLIKALKKRYGQREPSTACRRQLAYIKQEDEEDLDEYAERVHQLVIDGYPRVGEEHVQCLAVDAVLRGSKDKFAAVLAMGSKPKTIHKAVRKMKSAIQDQKSIGKGAFSLRQVSFSPESPQLSSGSKPHLSFPTQSASKAELKLMMMEALKDALRSMSPVAGTVLGRERSLSPASRQGTPRVCFICGDGNHFARECPKRTPSSSPSREGEG